jgi:hypothetical protein
MLSGIALTWMIRRRILKAELVTAFDKMVCYGWPWKKDIERLVYRKIKHLSTENQ